MRAFIAAIFVILNFAPSVRADDADLDRQIDQEVQQKLGENGLRQLALFKATVENESYQNTMRLCLGYRKMQGLSVHANDTGVTQSLAAWARVSKEGLFVPFSSIAGTKATALDVSQTRLLDFNSWAGSMYALYLINSWGFLKASVHCLNTMDQEKIQRFASAILLVDYESTLSSEIVMGWGFGETLKMIRGVVYAAKAKFLPGELISEIRRRQIRTLVAVASLPVGDSLIRKKAEDEHEKKMLMDFITSQAEK